MKILTKAGYFFGLLIIIASTIRWSITYIDYSQAIFGAALGLILLGASFVYQRLVDLTEDIKEIQEVEGRFNRATNDLDAYMLMKVLRLKMTELAGYFASMEIRLENGAIDIATQNTNIS